MINIQKMLSESQNISELERALEKEGKKFKTTLAFSAFLHGEWFNLQENKIKNILEESSPYDKGLPYSEVIKDGKIYRIHGIIHGNHSYVLAPSVKKHIKESIKVYISEGEDYLIEEDFGEFLNLDKSREIKVKREVSNTLLIKHIKILSRLLLEDTVSRLILKIFSLTGHSDDTGIRTIALTYESLNSISSMNKFHKIGSLKKLPEPFDLQLQQRTSLEVVVYMSYLMAKNMVYYANHNNLKILHCVTGFFHESQIKYYLNNPEYNSIK
jgi:hypothetical protein